MGKTNKQRVLKRGEVASLTEVARLTQLVSELGAGVCVVWCRRCDAVFFKGHISVYILIYKSDKSPYI